MPVIVVKPTAGLPKVTVTVDDTSQTTIAQLKKRLSGDLNCPEQQQRLIYKGQILKDEKTVAEYGIAHEHVIHFVKARPATESARSGSSVTPTSAALAANASAAAGGLSSLGGGGTTTGAGGGGNSGMQSIMQQAMSSPMMQQMLDNPEVLRAMVQANPQMRQLMDTHPEIAQLMNDPAMLRQSMQMASNPELMQQQVRQHDQALNNIQSHPEGFNALRNMYQSMQAPTEEAVASSAEASAAENPFASLFSSEGGASASSTSVPAEPPTAGAPNSVPMPNPWAPQTAGPGLTPAGASAMPPFGGMGGAVGGMPNQQLMSMLEQPQMMEAFQSLLSQPGMMQQLIAAHPQLRAMADADPGLRSMLSNPEAMRAMLQPQNMRALAQFQQGLASAGGDAAAGLPAQGGGPGLGGINWGQLMAGMGGGNGLGVPAPPPVADPETAYALQIQQLVDMGFFDRDANVRALQATGGNVNAAVERLLAS